ncbi:MAG: sigma 54-interacting transcriptional regulator [Pirellulales bacterium]|nr:sigma 54-interacting transcriptional regulator [Pirellulales bacterium]
MSPRRTNAAELAKLLDSATRPVYVLDEELTIVFLNRACREWLGTVAEGLVGQRCAYHSEPKSPGSPLKKSVSDSSGATAGQASSGTLFQRAASPVAAGLCPPPRILSGETVEATVCRVAEGEKFAPRSCRFVPLGRNKGDLFAIVAILDTEDRLPDTGGKKGTVPICRNGPEGALHKWGLSPFSPDDNLEGEAGAIALHEHICRFRNETAARYRADRLIGNGPAMRLARRQVELAAGNRSSVLLVGPPGSGRRRLAAAIHFGGGRKGTLATLDCSLLGADLLEALSSAAAKATARGLEAVPETLLLHRADELPADVQVQLTDFLSNRLSSWRLAATAAESLGELAKRGKFHADLAAMLSTIAIELPPLVQRREDIPLLAQMFIEERNAAGPRQIGGFSQTALDRLDAYHWPGNLDELAEVVAESHRRAAGREISPGDIPERLRLVAQAAAGPRRVEETIVLDEFLGRVERELIRRALARSKGNKARAARLLGVTRPRLYRRMVQLGLE